MPRAAITHDGVVKGAAQNETYNGGQPPCENSVYYASKACPQISRG
jgi:hypothetical protein